MEKKKGSAVFPLMTFAIPFLVYLVLMLSAGYLVPGSVSFYETSFYQEILPYILSFLRVLKGEANVWYSLSVLWGSGTIGAYASYAFSPFNLLYLADFLPLPLVTCLICGLKLGLASLSFYYFSKNVLKSSDSVSLFFSVSYALSSCMLLFTTRPMWLDACYMLPLLILLIRRLVKTGSFLLLIPAYLYLILCCFSVAVPVTILSLLIPTFFVFLDSSADASPKEIIKKSASVLLRCLISLACAAALGSFLLVPLFCMIREHSVGNASFPGAMLTLGDIISALFFCETPGFSSAVPYLYCGLPILFLLPLFFIDRKRDFKEKISMILILIFFLLTMIIEPVWRLFDPFSDGSIAYRFSFCIVFLFCTMGARYLSSSEGLWPAEKKHLPLLLSAVWLLFYALMLPVRELNSLASDSASMLSKNAFFLLLWAGYLLLLQKKRSLSLQRLAFVLLIAELFINGHTLFSSFPSVSPLAQSDAQIRTMRQTLVSDSEALGTDPTPFRVRINGPTGINDGIAVGLASVSSSSPYDSIALRQNLHYLGIAQGSGKILDYSAQELTDLMFGVKYRINPSAGTLTQYDVSLPIAYAVSEKLLEYSPTTNPFANQAKIIEEMTGKQYAFFTPIDPSGIRSESFNLDHLAGFDENYFLANNSSALLSRCTLSFPQNGHQKLLADFYSEEVTLRSATPRYLGFAADSNAYAPRLGDSAVWEASTTDVAGFFSDPDLFYLTLGSDDPPLSGRYEQSFMTYYDNNELRALAEDLGSYALETDTFSHDSFSGIVTIPEDRTLLFFSLPYDEGWDAYVDGDHTAILPVLNGCFCALCITPGAHSITMQYTAPGSTTGALISMAAVFVLVFLLCIAFLRRNHRDAQKNASKTEGESDE